MVRIPKNTKRPPSPEIPLNKLSRAYPDIRERLEMMNPKYLESLDDRALAIIDAANLERALEQAIMDRIRPLTLIEMTNLFIGDGAPLSTLSAKTKIGYAFMLFGKRTFAELDRIRIIRNQFAHSGKPINFDTPSIKRACRALETPGRVARPHPTHFPKDDPWPPTDAKMLYHFSAEYLASAFVLINEPPSHLPELNDDRLPLD